MVELVTDRSHLMFAVGLAICAALAALAIWDYVVYLRGGVTLSNRAKALWLRRRGDPWFWLTLGTVIGFAWGVVLGVVLGHLFWPQVVEP